MFSTKIKKLAAPLTAVALLAMAGTASAASGLTYKGKTDTGHNVTFKLKGGRVHDLVAGTRVSCVAIQGGGAPMGGIEIFGFKGSVPLKAHNHFSFMQKPSLYYNEVTMNHDLWLKRSGKTISGRMRIQYEFLIPKYTPGTFSIYSCLAGGTFKAQPVR
jgi:hypothetical protein